MWGKGTKKAFSDKIKLEAGYFFVDLPPKYSYMNGIYVEKFGGASVNSAAAVRNVVSILQGEEKRRIVVVSAMGKTTNSLEKIVDLWHSEKAVNNAEFDKLLHYHLDIAEELFTNEEEKISCKNLIKRLITESREKILTLNPNDYDFLYDGIVSYGERISTNIISAYMTSIGFSHEHVFAQDFIKTDNNFRNADIRWTQTEETISRNLLPLLANRSTVLTQGFIGSTKEGYTTTLGREGSDFSAAIFAYCTNAESMTIWKDVSGLMNADPKRMKDTRKLECVPYKEAMELAYYGASIIHPKTVKPLENKSIPLYVKSFNAPQQQGSVITDCENPVPTVPNYIFKDNQTLLSIFPKDFSFIAEDKVSAIFDILSSFGIKVNMMQNSALSFSVCFDKSDNLLQELIEALQQSYNVRYNNSLELITIRHYEADSLAKAIDIGLYNVLIEQKSRVTQQYLIERKADTRKEMS